MSTQPSASASSRNLNIDLPASSLSTTGDTTMQSTSTSTPSITVTSPIHETTTTIIEASNSSMIEQETTQVSNTPATMPILHPLPPPSVTSSVTIAAPPTSPPSQTQIPASQSQPAQDITPTDANSNTQNSSTTSPAPTPTVHADPQITLSFLHISGRRRTLSFPADTTVARVKEVVWNTWPKEWYDGSSGGVGGGLQNEGGGRDSLKDELPAAPGFIRLFCLGKMWTDESRLSGELSFFSTVDCWLCGSFLLLVFCFVSFFGFVSFEFAFGWGFDGFSNRKSELIVRSSRHCE